MGWRMRGPHAQRPGPSRNRALARIWSGETQGKGAEGKTFPRVGLGPEMPLTIAGASPLTQS